jgi:hypothetical protein
MIYTTKSKAVATASFLATVWAVAAAVQPTSTYHLAPLMLAGSVPVVAGGSGSIEQATNAFLGAGLAATVSVAVAASGWMLGPTLLPYGGPLAEAFTFTVVGSAAGVLLTTLNGRARQEDQSEYQRPETASR